MPPTREQVLSEFIDAWNAGQRPDVDDHIARAAPAEREALSEELATFLAFAPTPDYSDAALAAIRQEIERTTELRRGVLGALLTRLRERLGFSSADVAGKLVGELGLEQRQAPKTASYLERLEAGSLQPAGVSRRVLDALGHLLGIPGGELAGIAERGGWVGRPALADVAFRADEDAAARAERHLDVVADALAAPGNAQLDEVDELFLGGY